MKSNPLSSRLEHYRVKEKEGRPPNRPSIYIENAIGGRQFQ
jgi:hypothetical protein